MIDVRKGAESSFWKPGSSESYLQYPSAQHFTIFSHPGRVFIGSRVVSMFKRSFAGGNLT